jgi:hypothetical protein
MSFKFNPDKPFQTLPSTPAPPAATPAPARQLDEFEQEFASMRREITSWVRAVEHLRAEAENFIEWRNGMGEGVPGAKSWGEHQRMYTARTHTEHCIEAARLKEAAEKEFPGQSQLLFDGIFSKPGRWGVEISQQARKELQV